MVQGNRLSPPPLSPPVATAESTDALSHRPSWQWEYTAHIRVSLDELNELQADPAVSVYVFIGQPPSSSQATEWLRASNLAGAWHVKVSGHRVPSNVTGLANTIGGQSGSSKPKLYWRLRDENSDGVRRVDGPNTSASAVIAKGGGDSTGIHEGESATTPAGRNENGNRNDHTTISEGFVHLNTAISRAPHFRAGLFNPEIIVPYLTKALQWRMKKADGTAIDPLPNSLEVMVFATPLSYSPGTNFPVHGERTYYHGITYGKKGGSRSRDVDDEL